MSNVKRIDDHLLAKAVMAVDAINELIDSLYSSRGDIDIIDLSLEQAVTELDKTVKRLKKIRENKHG